MAAVNPPLLSCLIFCLRFVILAPQWKLCQVLGENRKHEGLFGFHLSTTVFPLPQNARVCFWPPQAVMHSYSSPALELKGIGRLPCVYHLLNIWVFGLGSRKMAQCNYVSFFQASPAGENASNGESHLKWPYWDCTDQRRDRASSTGNQTSTLWIAAC